MANARLFIPKVLKWEGGFVNDPSDHGGATNKGVTIATWKCMGYDNDKDGDIDIADLKLMTDEQAFQIMKKGYWDRWKADQINNQSVAEQLVDWVWGSGSWGIRLPQSVLNVKVDGVVGNQTIAAVNNYNQRDLHNLIKQERTIFINNIVSKNPSQMRFYKGWMNRVNSFKFVE